MGRGRRQDDAQCRDPRSGLYCRSAGEWKAYQCLKARSQEVPGLEGLVTLAENDLREAEWFNSGCTVWDSYDWRPEAYDADLLYVVAMVYVSRLVGDRDDEFQACAASAKVTEQILRRLVAFCSSLSACQFEAFDAETPALEAVEKLWAEFDECKDSQEQGLGDESFALVENLCTDLPPAMDVVKRVVGSTFFLSLPKRYAPGPGCATALASLRDLTKSSRPGLVTTLEEIEREVTALYEAEEIPFEDTDWEDYYRQSLMVYNGYSPADFNCPESLENLLDEIRPASWGALTCGQVGDLLSKSNDSLLLGALVFHRPPKSVFLSHLLAVYDCATHARLWLLKCYSSPYAAFRVTYNTLAREERSQDVEIEAYGSPLGFMERVPSFIEKLQRREAIHAFDSLYSTARSLPHLEQGVVFPIRNRKYKNVLAPVYVQTGNEIWTVDSLPHPLFDYIDGAFWCESKLKVFVEDKDEVQYYLNTSYYLKLVDYTRDLGAPSSGSFSVSYQSFVKGCTIFS